MCVSSLHCIELGNVWLTCVQCMCMKYHPCSTTYTHTGYCTVPHTIRKLKLPRFLPGLEILKKIVMCVIPEHAKAKRTMRYPTDKVNSIGNSAL